MILEGAENLDYEEANKEVMLVIGVMVLVKQLP